MSRITWNDGMSVGVRVLDDEHRGIMDLLQKLQDGVTAEVNSKELVGILTTLIQKTKAHLEHEEKLLKQTGFPGLEQHHKAHDAVLSKGLMLQARFMSGSTQPFTMESFEKVREWLEGHLLESDKEYAQHLNAHGIH